MKILAPLKPVIFQPSTYNLTDRGAVAIVEMNILVSAKHLYVVGGGSFQAWVVEQLTETLQLNAEINCVTIYVVSNFIRHLRPTNDFSVKRSNPTLRKTVYYGNTLLP